MHVLYIHQHFSTRHGATGTRSYEMSRRLIAAGHRVTMICGAYESSDLRSHVSGGVTEHEVDGIRVLRIEQPYANRMGVLQRATAFGRFARKATRVGRKLDADLVLATSTPLTVGIPGMKIATARRIPFVFEVRDLWPEIIIALGAIRNPAIIWYLRRLERRFYHSASRIIALSPGMKDGICRTGIPPDRVEMIPNGCDLDLFRPSEERLEDERFGRPGDLRLVFTGAHGLANGLDAVLDAAVELKRRGEGGIRFHFIGQGGQREGLIARSRDEGLEDWVTWHEPMPKAELAKVLPRLDMGMQTLRNIPEFHYGTSPNKFFDYIASGLPVLNNYPGWLADLIREHDCGLVVPPDDPPAFADAVVHARDHREHLREMGMRGRRLAEARFGRDQLGERFVGTLESALTSQSSECH